MRINIEVPVPSSTGSGSGIPSAPPTLVKLASSGELVLIELQGSLEIDDAHPQGGQALAKLEFHNGREDRPTLLISHHRLEGKIVALTKPFAVLEKKKKSLSRGGEKEEGDHHTISGKRSREIDSSPLRFPQASNGVGQSQEEEEEVELLDEMDGLTSPSMARKRARGDKIAEMEQTPVKSLKQTPVMSTFSSSPMPIAPMRGSELDFSSPLPTPQRAPPSTALTNGQDTEGEGEWLHKKSTSTYYEVVCIIRKKILFSKRPEPVVRLDGEGGDKARAALGLETN